MFTSFDNFCMHVYYSFCDEEDFIRYYYSACIIQRAFRNYLIRKRSVGTQTTDAYEECFILL